MRKIIVLMVVVLVPGAAAGWWYWQGRSNGASTFRTAVVERGRLEATIGATGTIQPEDVIDVGAQVTGRIMKFGQDLRDPSKTINYGSVVEEDTVLVQLDPSLYQAQRDAAKASLKKARADLGQQLAKLHQAQADWVRAQSLVASRAISQAEFDVAKAANEAAEAMVGVSKAQILVAEASLKQAQTNLDYTTVRSPVKGVIIDRRVQVGQTVVANFQAASLFLIAKDLRRVEVWAAVNEADVGQIRIGQDVRFTVDARPGELFHGKVIKQGDYPARFNANMTQNVVTYTVVVSVDNSKGELWPYWTANLQFVLDEKSDALLVPNAALRWRPKQNQIAPDAREAYAKAQQQKKRAAESGQDKSAAADKGGADKAAVEKASESHGTVWIDDNGYVRPVRIRTGLSDGVNTEILGGDLREGMQIVTGEGPQGADNQASNPFAPQIFGGKKQQ